MRGPRSLLVSAVTAAAFSLLDPLAAGAQQRDSLVQRWALPGMPMHQPEAPPAPPPVRSTYMYPGLTITSPNALGAEGGTVYLGVGYQARTRYLSREDGAVMAGVGLGDARRYVGLELNVTSYSTVRSGWFERMGFGAQVHRYLSPQTAVALGAENLLMVNGDESDSGRSWYAVATRLFMLREDPGDPFSVITATVGLGDGRFRSEHAVWADRSEFGVFGAVSVHVARPVAVIADWSGQDLGLGLSLAPFRRFALVITPAVVDITRNAGDGGRFVLSVGVGRRVTRGSIQF